MNFSETGKRFFALTVAASAAMYAAAAFGWSDVLLTGADSAFVERDADGNPVYLTNATAWYYGSPAYAFDGKTSTYADPKGGSS